MSTTSLTPPPARTQSLVLRHPLISFFVLTYAVAWLLWAPLVIFRDRVPAPLAFVLLLLGSLVPSTVGVVLVALLRGRSGVRTLLGRLLRARIGLRWYLAVLALTMLGPLAVGVSLLFGGATPVVDTTVSRRPRSCSPSPFSRAALWVKKLDGEVSPYHACRHGIVP